MGKEVDQKEIQINNVRRNVKILHRSDNWLKLAFLESLAIREHRPPLNTGIKATKEFVCFKTSPNLRTLACLQD